MITYITIAEQQKKKYYLGVYKSYNRAISYGLKDIEKMKNAVIITGNKNNVDKITIRVYRKDGEKISKNYCYMANLYI